MNTTTRGESRRPARRALGAALLAILALPSCATTHAARWAYGMDSIHDKPSQVSENVGLRPFLGVPLILASVAWDALTWPEQLIFGIWPMWGRASLHMKPTSKS